MEDKIKINEKIELLKVLCNFALIKRNSENALAYDKSIDKIKEIINSIKI